ncbi:hypothetical protein [Halogranum rubrum]|nr:hypothetical protein [Halogranum salarium]
MHLNPLGQPHCPTDRTLDERRRRQLFGGLQGRVQMRLHLRILCPRQRL